MTFKDYPKAATENAKRALKFREETENKNNCGTPVGWARANQLAKREAISFETVKRMAAFNRHRQNKDVPYEEGCGGLMWDAWGGTEGINWAKRKVEQIEKEMENKYSFELLNDVFDYGYELQELNSLLKSANGSKVEINIASNGGSVFAGIKLGALIENYEGQTVSNIYGLAASIATVVALAADEVLISKNAFFMIHKSWAFFVGNEKEIKKDLEVLEEIDEMLLDIYVSKIKKSGKLMDGSEEKTREEVKKMMEEETFLNSSKAIELGLVDGYIKEESNNTSARAMANLSKKTKFYNKLPNQLFNTMPQNENKEKKGLFASFAKALGFSKEDAKEALEALPEATEETQIEAKVETTQPEAKKENSIEARLAALEANLQKEAKEKEDLKAKLKEIEAQKAQLEKDIEDSASHALLDEPKAEQKSESKYFSPERCAKLDAMFNKALGRD